MSDHRAPESSIPLSIMTVWILLTPPEKTTFVFLPDPKQEAVAQAIIDNFGEPEFCEFENDKDPPCLWVIYPHRNFPPAALRLAEQMTTWVTLHGIGAPEIANQMVYTLQGRV